MSLYEFLIENKNRAMHALIDRDKRMPQQCYAKFFSTDNPDDFDKSTMGLCVQGRLRQNIPENEPETQPDSLAQKIRSLGKKTLKLSKDALEKTLGRNVQNKQPRDIYEAWASLFCRDPRALEGIEEEIKMPEWREVKDPKTKEMYKETGDRLYEYDRWILAFLYNEEIGMHIATMVYRHPGQFTIREYYHQVSVMLDWMMDALKPRQQTQPPRKMSELERYDSDVDNDIIVGDNHQATFAIRGKEAGLVIGNIPDLSQDTINDYVIKMSAEGYSAGVGNGRLAIVKRLQKKPSEMEAIEIKLSLINYAIDFVKMLEEPP